jgi:hypothetical protein
MRVATHCHPQTARGVAPSLRDALGCWTLLCTRDTYSRGRTDGAEHGQRFKFATATCISTETENDIQPQQVRMTVLPRRQELHS